MLRKIILIIAIVLAGISAELKARNIVVADSASRVPLPAASIYDRKGKALGVSTRSGVLPAISIESFPITIRYIGFEEKIVSKPSCDTVFMVEDVSELPEFVVEARDKKMLHILAFVRELSTLTTYTDTVLLFREKMVDYMLRAHENVKYKGWSTPRVLSSRSFYRFTNQDGLDSVSDRSNHHFSWSDWVGIPQEKSVPAGLITLESGNDTIYGKYSPAEIWTKTPDNIAVEVNVLADTLSRRWVPNLSVFFKRNIDFEKFKVKYEFINVGEDTLRPINLTACNLDIESNGRGHEMFRFNHRDEPFFVCTQADIYILDREFITISAAKKWEKKNFAEEEIDIYEPAEIQPLPASIRELIARVENQDHDSVRLNFTPDHRLGSFSDPQRNFRIGRRALLLLKQVVGIEAIQSHRNSTKQWRETRNKIRSKKRE